MVMSLLYLYIYIKLMSNSKNEDNANNFNIIKIDRIKFLTKDPFEYTKKFSKNNYINPSYYLTFCVNNKTDNIYQSKNFNIRPNQKNNIEINLQIELENNLEKLIIRLYQNYTTIDNNSQVQKPNPLLSGGIRLRPEKLSKSSEIHTLECNLLNDKEEVIAKTFITYLKVNSNIMNHNSFSSGLNEKANIFDELINEEGDLGATPIDLFETYLKECKVKNEKKKKEDVITLSKDKKFSLLDLASGQNAENFNTFIKNTSYIRALLNGMVSFIRWDNPYRTLALLCIFSFILHKFTLSILVLIPLLLIVLHLTYQDNLVKTITLKDADCDKIANLHLIMWIIDVTNTLIHSYETLVQEIQSAKEELLKEVYFNLFKLIALSAFGILILGFDLFKIDLVLIFTVIMWLIVLSQFSPIKAFCLVLFDMFVHVIDKSIKFISYMKKNKDNQQHDKKNKAISIAIKIMTFSVPFLDMGIKIYKLATKNKNDSININKAVKNLIYTPQVVFMPSSKKDGSNTTNELFKYELYENERWWLGLGFKKKLFNNEIALWCRCDNFNEYCDMNMITLPTTNDDEKYVWTSEWQIELNENCDNEGWEYSTGFKNKEFGEKTTTRNVRRRKWVRYAKKEQLS